VKRIFLLVVLVGCSDTALVAAPEGTRSLDEDAPAVAPAPSPWDGLGDDVPRDLWVVAWTPEGDANGRLDAIDVLGRSVLSFVPPAWPDAEGLDLSHYEALEIQSGAPGQALVTLQAATFPSLTEKFTRLYARLDGAAATADYVLAVGFPDRLHLPGPDREVVVDVHLERVLVAPDPTEPERLWFIGAEAGDDKLAGSLLELDLSAPVGAVGRWSLDEVFGQPIAGFWALQPVELDDGHALLLGVDRPGGARTAVAWRPDEGILASVDVDGVGAFERADLLARGGSADGVVVLPRLRPPATGFRACGPDFIELASADGLRLVPVSDGASCHAAEALVDPVAPTLLVRSWEPDQPETLVVSHRRDEVWSIDTISVGLTDHPFRLDAVAPLPLP